MAAAGPVAGGRVDYDQVAPSDHAALLPIEGVCDPRFAAVRAAFHDNFALRGEVGAAVAVSIDGRVVVDLWSGWADLAHSRPWRSDTLVNFFSVGKALTALCVHRLVERGRLDLDVPVGCYWPEFAVGAKSEISLRQILSHRAGLPAVRAPLPDGAMLDWDVMIAALQGQEPWWTPGEGHGYHVNTFGFLLGEIVRRSCGRTIGALLRDEIAAPLAADVHIGLSPVDQSRAAEFLWPALGVAPNRDQLSDENLMRWSAYFNPSGISGAGWINDPRWRAAEIPSTNGHGTARGVARIYAALARGGALDGVRVVEPATLAAALVEHSAGLDRITERPARFGLGFQLTQVERPLGPNPGAFGHFGAGGSLGFGDPESRVAFAYLMNEMGPRWQNPRNRALVDAVYSSV